MKILFENIEEFRACVPWLYATAKLDSFMLDIELATEDLIEVLGEEIYDRVLKAYNDGEQQELDVELIRRFQLPIALNAYLSWSRNQDVSHEEDGRKVKIDKESESLPWQWMLDRDDAGIRDKAGKAVDRLIAFLDKNVESIVEWKESDQRKDMRSLFVSNATEFDQSDINGSRADVADRSKVCKPLLFCQGNFCVCGRCQRSESLRFSRRDSVCQ